MLRITSGMSSRLVGAELQRIPGHDGTPCIKVLIDSDGPDESECDTAMAAISGLKEEGAGAAIVDGDGRLLAADSLFAGFSIPEDKIGALVRDVRHEEDRLVKRLLTPSPATPVAIAIARLTDMPARHLVMAVPAADEARPAEKRVLPEAHDATEHGEPADETVSLAAEVQTPVAEAPEAARLPDDAQATRLVSFEPDFEAVRGPVRFVWKTDSNGRFTDISPEFGAAVGPNAADIVGRTFEDVARVFELDPSGEISASLTRRDTWSGKSVMWPVQGTAYRVPVDLAALPSYNRDREFEGYRGFGIVRMGERREDPEGLGLTLTVAQAEAASGDEAGDRKTESAEAIAPQEPERPEDDPREQEADTAVTHDAEAPQAASPSQPDHEGDKVIDLASKRRGNAPGEALNANEEAAFRQIGDLLGWARTMPDAREPQPDEPDEMPETDPPLAESPQSREDDYIAACEDDAQTDLQPDVPVSEGDGESAPGAEVPEDAAEARDTGTGEEADPAADEHHYIPSAFATGHEPESADDRGDLTPSFLDDLPLPVLIHRDDEALYVNEAFAGMSGYETPDALNRAGGIDALFNGETGGDGMLCLNATDGSTVTARAHMQAIQWGGRTALLFVFEPREQSAGTDDLPADAGVSEAEELRAILDTASDGVVVLTAEGVIRSVNASASALFGYSGEELEGKSFAILFAQESQAAALDYLHGLSHNGVASVLNEGLEVLGREKNGGFLPLFMTIGRLETSNGFCAVVRDITAWKQTEQALREAQRNAENASTQKTEFLAKISHEIRTPLNAIIGFSELMAEERFGPIGNERYKSYLADINKSGKYVLDLVNDLLDISKIEAGKQELEFESVSLNEAVSEAVAMIQPQANRNRIIVRSSLDEDLPDVVADARSLKQIVLNILSNSVRFTHSGGQVIISTCYNARSEVVLRIKDTGIGMSAKEIETALQPFQQVASLGRARGDGTGLGLPLTKALVEANRAEFAIQSEPGRGTAVEIVFPPSRVLAS
ncbi:PAS domain S-box protein [Oricola thermophila]|uniref:histidine kinase n=2 Tax=Oricola thermophila TaxID=2742145 RepID=A0A6N1VJP8_9HYPH|nr:PAS domain S-box protein [Oricola thermophila]